MANGEKIGLPKGLAAPARRALASAGVTRADLEHVFDPGDRVVHYGPFVKNTCDEILQAIENYQAGRLGTIPPTSSSPGTSRERDYDEPPSTQEHAVSEACRHLDQIADVAPSSEGCEDCLPIGGRWVHLRMCMTCGHVGCCDNSPNRHATAHFNGAHHPIIQSYEPGEDWWFCYLDDLAFLVDGAPSFEHP